MGILEGSCCPHYNSEAMRESAYKEQVSTGQIKPGWAIDEYSGVHYIDGKFHHAISSQDNNGVYHLEGTEVLPSETQKLHSK